MCLACIDKTKKKSIANQSNQCDGKHTPFATFNQIKRDVAREYLKLKKEGTNKTQYTIDQKGVIDPPDSDYTLAVTTSLEGHALPQQDNIRISFI